MIMVHLDGVGTQSNGRCPWSHTAPSAEAASAEDGALVGRGARNEGVVLLPWLEIPYR